MEAKFVVGSSRIDDMDHAVILSRVVAPAPPVVIASQCTTVHKPFQATVPGHDQSVCVTCGVMREKQKCTDCETGYMFSCCLGCCVKCRGVCEHACPSCTRTRAGQCPSRMIGPDKECCKDADCSCCENSSFQSSMHRLHSRTQCVIGTKLVESVSPFSLECCGKTVGRCWWSNEDPNQTCISWAESTDAPRKSLAMVHARRFRRADDVYCDVNVPISPDSAGTGEYIAIDLSKYVDKIFKFAPGSSNRLAFLPMLCVAVKFLNGWKVTEFDVVLATKGENGVMVEQRQDYITGSDYYKPDAEKNGHVNVRHSSWSDSSTLDAVLIRNNVHNCVFKQLAVLSSIPEFGMSAFATDDLDGRVITIGPPAAKTCSSSLAYLACKYRDYLCSEENKGVVMQSNNKTSIKMRVQPDAASKWMAALAGMKQRKLIDLSALQLRLYPVCRMSVLRERLKAQFDFAKTCDISFYGQVNHLV